MVGKRGFVQRHGRGWLPGVVLLAIVLPAAAGAADPLTVEAASGAAKIRFADLWQTPRNGMVVSLPAIVSTGDDGSVRLRQGETFISVAANTAIELSPGAAGDGLVQNVVQEAGSAFYDIAPQKSKRFRVDSPYLVAVVKGTQFNVTVTPDNSSVALFEGLLQIDAPEIDASTDIVAGQIARRHRDDTIITVIDMDTGDLIAGAAPGAADADTQVADALADGAPNNLGSAGNDPAANLVANVGANLGALGATAGLQGGVDVGVAALDAGVTTGVDLGSGSIDAGIDTGIDVGGSSVDAGIETGIDLGGGSVGAGIDTGIDVGGGLLDADIDLDLGLSTDPDDGLVDVDLGVDSESEDTGTDVDEGSTDDGLLPDLGDILGL